MTIIGGIRGQQGFINYENTCVERKTRKEEFKEIQ